MNKFSFPKPSPAVPHSILLWLCLTAILSLARVPVCFAQTLSPGPVPIGTPTVNPTPAPSPTPVSTPTPPDTPAPVTTPAPTGTPQITIAPGVPDPSVFAAYNALRTPLIDVTLNATNTGGSVVSGGATTTKTVRPQVQDGVCTQIRLPSPTVATSNASRAASATAGANSQPVVTVVLTYDLSWAGQLVWVQMARGGTLTADDGAGHTYDGSNGFFLTLDANAMATFNYQAPSVSGTYQVLTRLSNVIIPLPFLVPDPGS